MCRWVSTLVIVVLMLFMTACAFFSVRYFRPSAQEGKLVLDYQADCLNNSYGTIEFERQEVIAGAVVYNRCNTTDDSCEDKDFSEIYLGITFRVPEGRVVRLLDQVVEVSFPTNGAVTGNLYPPRQDAPMVGTTTRVFLWHMEHAFYRFKAAFQAPNPDTFTLKFPRFSVNGVEVELPVINFTKDSEVGVFFLNC